MKIEIRDGRIGAAMNEPNADFIFVTDDEFTGHHDMPFRWADVSPVGTTYSDVHRLGADNARLYRIIAQAERRGIEVSDEVRVYAAQLKACYEQAALERWQNSLRDRVHRTWANMQLFGCGNCEHLCSFGEDGFYCSACKEELPVQNKPEHYNGTYYMYNWRPYPSGNCPKKAEDQK